MNFPFWVVPQSVLIVLLRLYLWWRLVHSTAERGTKAHRVATWVVVGLAALIPAALVATYTWDPTASRWFAWPGFVWYVLVYLVVILVAAEPVRIAIAARRRLLTRSILAGSAVASMSPTVAMPAAKASVVATRATVVLAPPASPPTDPTTKPPSPQVDEPVAETTMDRRRFLARSLALTAGVGAAGVAGPGMVTVLGPPRLEHAKVRLRRLPARAAGNGARWSATSTWVQCWATATPSGSWS